MPRRPPLAIALVILLAGCGRAGSVGAPTDPGVEVVQNRSDPEKARAADYSILFVGNSHTLNHDLPGLVGRMIRFQHPERTVYARTIVVSFLEDVARMPACREEVESRAWKFAVLQAQKISASGKFDYSRREGIDFAILARERSARVYFFSEWGLRNVEGDGARQEAIYREMASAAGVGVARVGRAWDLALAARPELPLYDEDGNHETAVGAFLTACVLAGAITGESPAPLAGFDYAGVGEADRAFLAETAAKALAEPIPK